MKNIILFTTFLLLCLSGYSQISKWEEQQMKKSSGKYSESGSQHDPPYTTFYKDPTLPPPGPTWNQSFIKTELDKLHKRITADLTLRTIYEKVYLNGSTLPGGGNDAQEIIKANAVKSAAFVYLCGIKVTNSGGGPTAGWFAEPGQALTSTDLNTLVGFRERALEGMFNMGIKVYGGVDEIQHRSKALILYLQAYDYLATAATKFDQNSSTTAYIHQRYVHDGNLRKIRDRLQFFAKQLMERANNINGAFARHNNHSLMAAGALGLASIVLNGCGFNEIQTDWHPSTWAKAANTIINHVNFEKNGLGLFDKPMSDRNLATGYAEGPHYFAYAFENLTPFFLAYRNFVYNNTFARSYSYRFKSASVANYLHEDAYKRMYQWYASILHPDGTAPSFDNTNAHEELPCFMAIPRNRDWVPVYPKYTDFEHMNLAIDFLVSFVDPNPAPPVDPNYLNPYSGDIILRTSVDQPLTHAHYMRIGVERNTAVYGGGHEHGDATGFTIYSGKYPLAIDPPYIGYDARKAINDGIHHNVILVDGKGPTTDISTGLDPQILWTAPGPLFKLNTRVWTGYYGASIVRASEMTFTGIPGPAFNLLFHD